jgi:histidinol phosphatase-like enzyme
MLLKQDSDAMPNESYVCTSLNDSGDPRMKPNPGMILEACQNEKVAKVSPNKSVMIGDSLSDLQAAQAGGISRKILVSIGYGSSLMGGVIPSDDPMTITLIERNMQLTDSLLPFVYAENLHQATELLLLKPVKKSY